MKIPDIKVKVLQQDIENGVTDEEKLLKFFKVEKLEDVTEAQFRDYVDKRNKAEKK